MGQDGWMWLNDDDTMTLEEYRKERQKVEHKKSDFIEAVLHDINEGNEN